MSLDRETVVLELDKGEEGLWRSYSSVHRNMIRKAQKSGLRCAEVDPKGEMEAFKGLYLETMRRAHAARYYFFSDRYFEALVHLLGDRLRLFVVRHGDLIVAASLFLVYGETVHYHLSAGLESYRSLGPTNLLLHWVALWCLAEGHRYLHLGGGRTSSPDDSLLRFKASISKVRRGYYTGRRIRNATEYESLCRKWMRLHRVVERPDYFLLYRLEG
jgi:lipid II:glycine glycyltransferase (peptidoglycan interpeptide bridge formation enzyme)